MNATATTQLEKPQLWQSWGFLFEENPPVPVEKEGQQMQVKKIGKSDLSC